jgi:hypothetical protein
MPAGSSRLAGQVEWLRVDNQRLRTHGGQLASRENLAPAAPAPQVGQVLGSPLIPAESPDGYRPTSLTKDETAGLQARRRTHGADRFGSGKLADACAGDTVADPAGTALGGPGKRVDSVIIPRTVNPGR